MFDATDFQVLPFRPRLPWVGADLQTLRNRLLGPVRRPTDSGEIVEFVMPDGTGDTLTGDLHRPTGADAPVPRPLVILVHGLTGCAESDYVLATAAVLLEQGYPCLRLNLRGAGPGKTQCRERYHAGRGEDLRAVLEQVFERDGFAAVRTHGIVAVGYSLGGNMLLKLAAEDGETTPLRAVVAVSSPVDLMASSVAIRRARNTLYHRYLLRRMKKETLTGRGQLTVMERDAIMRARTVFEFDDRFVAPRNGFGNAETYYRSCAAGPMLGDIAKPALVVQAQDDPWVPAGSVVASWPRAAGDLRLMLSSSGGHVGFHGTVDGQPNGPTLGLPWSDMCILEFFDEVAG